jgi:Protein of unknown function (DUF2934)
MERAMKHSPPLTAANPPPGVGTTAPSSREARVREQAYALYEARGKTEGHALDDWLEAEARVGRPSRPAAVKRQPKPAAG